MRNIDIGYDILSSYMDEQSGSILINIGDSITETASYADCESYQHIGFASRPSIAQPGKDAAQCISLHLSTGNVIIGSKDIRGQAIYGALKPGETSLYASGPENTGTGRILLKDDGKLASITTLIQEDNKDSGLPIMMSMSSDSTINIINSKYNTIQMNRDGVSIVSNGTLSLGAKEGFTIIGKTMAINSGAVSIGANASESPALEAKVMAELDKIKQMILKTNSAIPSGISDPSVAVQAAIPTPPLGSRSVTIAS